MTPSENPEDQNSERQKRNNQDKSVKRYTFIANTIAENNPNISIVEVLEIAEKCMRDFLNE